MDLSLKSKKENWWGVLKEMRRGGIYFFVVYVLEFRMDLEKQNRGARVLG